MFDVCEMVVQNLWMKFIVLTKKLSVFQNAHYRMDDIWVSQSSFLKL